MSIKSPGNPTGTSGPSQPAVPEAPSVRQPKKKKSFLSLLCCGTPDHTNSLDAPVPANKVSKFSLSRPTTAKQPDSSKMGQQNSVPTVPQIEKETLQQPQQLPQAEAGDEKHDTTSPQGTTKTIASSSEANGEPNRPIGNARDQPLPDLPTVVEAEPTQPETANPIVSIDAPAQSETAVGAVSPTSDLGQQDGGDEKMTSLDPGTTESEEAPLPLPKDEPLTGPQTLPPPPPVPQIPTADEVIEVDQMEQKQQWLLPPIAPRFKGKKCLVLDLDETLVHSSFKVRP